MTEERAIAEYIRDFRKKHKLSQEQLAEKCNVSIDTISHLEREIANPSLKTLRALASFMGTTIIGILQGRQDKSD